MIKCTSMMNCQPGGMAPFSWTHQYTCKPLLPSNWQKITAICVLLTSACKPHLIRQFGFVFNCLLAVSCINVSAVSCINVSAVCGLTTPKHLFDKRLKIADPLVCQKIYLASLQNHVRVDIKGVRLGTPKFHSWLSLLCTECNSKNNVADIFHYDDVINWSISRSIYTYQCRFVRHQSRNVHCPQIMH